MIRESACYWIQRAYREHWAIGMFNAHHLEAVQAIALAADHLGAPVMLSTTMGGLRHVGLDYFVGMVRAARLRSSAPLILHLDHGANLETVGNCIEAGFDSVMIDASGASYDGNVTLVRKVVALARRHGVGVEAQIGETFGEEGRAGTERKTTVAEALAFARDTEVDYLAVSIGNTPGQLDGSPSIDVPLVRSLSEALKIPLVLHGGTSVPPSIVQQLVMSGIAKVNIDAAVKGAFREVFRETYGVEDPMLDTRVPLARARELAQKAVEARIGLFGAIGRADGAMGPS